MILLLLCVGFVVFLVHQFWYRRLDYPDGPLPIPLMGNLHTLMRFNRWEPKFVEWKEKYGPIYTFWMGPQPMVLVSDHKLMQEMFIHDGDLYIERMTIEKFDKVTRGGDYGIINTSGDLWREQRRFALRVLRDFGLSKAKMEERVLEEVQTICENINRDIEAGVEEHDFHRHTDLATGSVINTVVNGYRFSTGGKEEEFYRLKETTTEVMKVFARPAVALGIFNPQLFDWPIIKQELEKAASLFNVILSFIEKQIDEHLKLNDYSDPNLEPRDFMDAYLQEMHRCEERGERHYFSKIQLKNVGLDLWFAGQETTSSTMTWGFALLCRHPDVQAKLHEEFDRVIGSNRLITMADKNELPYTQAFITEIQRWSNIVVLNLLRILSRDVEVRGMKLKKGTVCIPMMATVHWDPKIFKEPERFNPSRFIDSNGQFKAPEEVTPFSIGKRQCLGEGLARMELFLFLANFLNQYKFSSGREPPTLKRQEGGGGAATEPYKCRVERRF